ncbi:F0F1 ATP synthase subunit delta [uncultured Jatrophihabitans sp.]|uniref:F0F1 ATP synthase subunit delta n=1 Tax=uncultured Jatrophihabitans sp. TaxID=1610747 RepID=UPI0035CA7CD7
MMRSASRQALETLQDEQRSAVGPRAHATTLVTLAQELYAVADLLVGNPRLRRTVGDPATPADDRVGILEGLIGSQIGEAARRVVAAAVRLRWSNPWDLCDSLESAGDDALFASAEKRSELDTVEDELFRFERIIQGDGELVALLDEYTVDPARRRTLLDSLLGGKVSDATKALLDHAVSSQRKRSILLAIDDLLELAAKRQERSIARVVSASPLSDAQQRKLTRILTEMYGREITLRTALDPAVQGGLVIRVGDEVIDGSVAARFATARSSLTT